MAAFNNSFPYIYPQMYYQPPVAYQTATQGQIPGAPTGILWVSGEQEAQNYPVAPNNAVALWDSTRATVYLKQADASGKPSIKTYDLTERAETARVSILPAPEGKDTPYAKKSDVEELSAAVEQMRAELESLTKKTRKREVNTDDE